jgi:hypothetical protein
MNNNEKAFWGVLAVAAFTVPIFRSGGKSGLTFWGFIINHTIWGSPVEYVPEEQINGYGGNTSA